MASARICPIDSPVGWRFLWAWCIAFDSILWECHHFHLPQFASTVFKPVSTQFHSVFHYSDPNHRSGEFQLSPDYIYFPFDRMLEKKSSSLPFLFRRLMIAQLIGCLPHGVGKQWCMEIKCAIGAYPNCFQKHPEKQLPICKSALKARNSSLEFWWLLKWSAGERIFKLF